MTSNEILKADVLDILFENRNKQYGAYALRKYYNNRMTLALCIALAAVLLAALLIQQASGRPGTADEGLSPDAPIVRLINVFTEPEPPVEPPPPPPVQRPIATQAYTSQIEIVANVAPEDMVPDHTDLVDPQIGTTTVEGALPTESRTVESPAASVVERGEGVALAAPDFVAVERQPEFPGGAQAWAAFLGRHLRVPADLEAGERRTVQVRFWVGEDGSIARMEVVQSAGAAFDQEVMRVLRKMPRWKPALQNGHPVAVTFTQPVTFQAFEE